MDGTDSGWQNLSTNGNAIIGGNGMFKVRKIGNVVFIQGRSIVLNAALNAGSSRQIATLPSEYRPIIFTYAHAGHSGAIGHISIDESGAISFNPITAKWVAGQGLQFTISYIVN